MIRGGIDEGGAGDNGGDQGGNDGSGNGGADGDADDQGTDAEGDGDGADDASGDDTQAKIDAAVKTRLAKERAKWDREQKTKADREKLDETARLKAEKDDADRERDEAKRDALQARVDVTAERQALAAGIDPEKVERFLKVAELGDLDDLTDDGQPDSKAIRKVVDKQAAKWPEFKAEAKTPGRSGGEMNGGGGEQKATTLEDAVAAHYAG